MVDIARLPTVAVEIDGRPLREDDAHTLLDVTIVQKLSRPTLCELRFADPKGNLAETLVAGSTLDVRIEAGTAPLFKGDIVAIDYIYEPARGREVRLRGFDTLHRLRLRQPVRAHVEVTAEDVARELVLEDGLQVEAVQTGSLRRKIIQHRQTDFDLLLEVTAAEGLYFVLRDRVLHLLNLRGIATEHPPVLALGEQLLEAHIELDGASTGRSVTASGWDPWTAESYRGDADAPRGGRQIRGEVPPDLFGSTGTWWLTDEAIQAEPQLQAMAQAELDDRSAREVILTGVADGNPELRPGTPIELTGVAPGCSGSYVLAETIHRIDGGRGYVTEFSTRPPDRRQRPWSSSMSFAVVSDVEDPDGYGRIKVTYPTYSDIESDWLAVVVPGAGEGKGLVALPDVGDRVLVAFPRQDPGQGVVLGGLYGTRAPPDNVIGNGAVQRFTFRSPGGQFVRLDDESNTIRVENRAGSFVELTPDKATVHAATDLDIAAPGHKVTIRGAAIDFKKA